MLSFIIPTEGGGSNEKLMKNLAFRARGVAKTNPAV